MTDIDKLTFSLDAIQLQNARDLGSVRAIFGQDSAVEFNKDKNSWMVKGVLTDGICQGGQSYFCEVNKTEITDEQGTTYYVWQMGGMSINGRDITEYFEAPVYFFRPTSESDESDAWFSFATSMDAGFDYNFHRIYMFAGIQNIDQLVSLVHENSHAICSMNTTEVSQSMKMFREITKAISLEIATGVSEDEVIERTVLLLKEKGIYDIVKLGAIDTFNEEVNVNNIAFDFFQEEVISGIISKDDDSQARLKKMLTVSSLSYAQTINKIFGQGTVDPRHAEIM